MNLRESGKIRQKENIEKKIEEKKKRKIKYKFKINKLILYATLNSFNLF